MPGKRANRTPEAPQSLPEPLNAKHLGFVKGLRV